MRTNANVEVGDLVVRPLVHDDRLVYVLNVVPGPGQMFVRSREDAVKHAVKFATRQGVRAWMLDEGDHLVLLGGPPPVGRSAAVVRRPAVAVSY